MGEERIDEKSNEITAISDLIDQLNIKGHIITTDAMGTQKEIVKKIRRKKADYVLTYFQTSSIPGDEKRVYI